MHSVTNLMTESNTRSVIKHVVVLDLLNIVLSSTNPESKENIFEKLGLHELSFKFLGKGMLNSIVFEALLVEQGWYFDKFCIF